MSELMSLIDHEIPIARQNLLDNHKNLEKVAVYCETNYFQANDKRLALQETKDYTTRSLASVAYQINTLACQLLHMLNLQSDQLTEMESQINHISQTIAIHKEKVARREIGVLTTNKCINSQHKILVPANPERPIKYTRKPIDYSILDDIGHGVKIPQQQNLPRTKRLGSASGIYGEITGLSGTAPTSKPPNPPQHSTLSRHTGSALGLGTLSRNSKEYRTPVPVVAPPQVPSNYAANYPQGHPRASQNSMSTTGDYRTGSEISATSGVYSTLPMNLNQQPSHQQLISQQIPNPNLMQPPQIGMVHPISQINNSQQPPNNPSVNNTTAYIPSGSSTPPPPPLPIHSTNLDRTSGTISPPLPSPPAMDEQPVFGQQPAQNDWIPKEFVEKVISIYEYQASRNDELSFKENSIIYVIKKNDDGWYEGVMDGITGLFPGNYVHAIVERKRLKPVDTALNHFDLHYSKIFGKKWRSIRLGLLSPNKHVAVVNSYLDTEIIEEDLKLQRSVELGTYYEKYFKRYQRMKIREKILEKRRDEKRNMCLEKGIDESSVQTDTDISESEFRKYDQGDLTSSTAEDAKFLFSTDSEGDESRFFNEATTNLNLNTFVPVTEMISQEDEKLIKRDYQLDENYKIDFIDQNKLEFPKNLKVYINKRGVLTYSKIKEDDEESKNKDEEDSDFEEGEHTSNVIYSGRNQLISSFPYPKKDEAKNLLNYFVMDSASILPVICLDIKPGDVVADYCAAPGGKALSMFFTKCPSRILMNDSSLSRNHRLQTVMRSYLPRYEINQKIEFRNSKAESMIESNSYDKILLDVPCTNDKISVLSNQNNIFKSGRIDERVSIPDLQIMILIAGLKSLKKGGDLIYSTCSLSPAQNDFVVRAALERLETDSELKFSVYKLREAFRPLRPLYKFFYCEYGNLVVPFVPSNSGPMYVSKIKRVE